MALGLGKTNCEATAGKVESSGNCALPNQTSANLDSDREKSLDRCLQELNAGLTLGYNYPASQNPSVASEPTLDTKATPTKSAPENKNAPKLQNSKPGLTPTAFAECLTQAAKTHNVPAAVLIGIMRVEGNHVGQTEGPVKDGSYRLGPMRISSLMVPELARKWNVSEEVAYKWVRDDGCVNVEVAAWILKNKIDQYGTLVSGIAHYHSDDPTEGQAYSEKVVKTMKDFDLIKQQ